MATLDELTDSRGEPLLDALGGYLDAETDVLLDAGYAPLTDDAGQEIDG